MSNQRMFKRAVEAYERRSFGVARKAFEKIIKNEPEHLDARYLLGTLFAQQGKSKQALHHLNIAAQLDPESPMIQTNLGILYQSEGNLIDAEALFRAALRKDDCPFQAYFNLAVVLYKQHRLSEAIASLQTALLMAPHLFDAHMLLAKVYKEAGDLVYAENSIHTALDIQPENVEALHLMANILAAQDRTPEAREIYQRIVSVAPNDESAAFVLSVLSGDKPNTPPGSHLKSIFNEMAESFDAHLDELGYQGPRHLLELFDKHVKDEDHCLRMLDMGCGTGGAGRVFRSRIDYLSGIDIAERMVDASRETGCYDKLRVADIHDLPDWEQNFDLVVAADVMPYLGDPEQVIPAIRAHMTPGGYLLFTTERNSEVDDFHIVHTTGRYQVSDDYIKRVAEENNFTIIEMRIEPLRREKDQWIEGHFCVWQALAR